MKQISKIKALGMPSEREPSENKTRTLNKKAILNKLKTHFNLKSKAAFARFLGIKPQTLSTWYTRNTFDLELLYFKCVGVDANWLLTGEGDMLKVFNERPLLNENLSQDNTDAVFENAIGLMRSIYYQKNCKYHLKDL